MIRKAPVSMIMTTPVITLKKDDSLEKAEYLFKKHHIRHIPIVDKNEVIGMLSYTDLQRLRFVDLTEDSVDESMVESDVMVYEMFTINQIMSRNVVTITSSSSIKDVAKIFIKEEFHALPIVNHNKLIGIVTTTDLIKYLLLLY